MSNVVQGEFEFKAPPAVPPSLPFAWGTTAAHIQSYLEELSQWFDSLERQANLKEQAARAVGESLLREDDAEAIAEQWFQKNIQSLLDKFEEFGDWDNALTDLVNATVSAGEIFPEWADAGELANRIAERNSRLWSRLRDEIDPIIVSVYMQRFPWRVDDGDE